MPKLHSQHQKNFSPLRRPRFWLRLKIRNLSATLSTETEKNGRNLSLRSRERKRGSGKRSKLKKKNTNDSAMKLRELSKLRLKLNVLLRRESTHLLQLAKSSLKSSRKTKAVFHGLWREVLSQRSLVDTNTRPSQELLLKVTG